jgi:cytochrome c-type biogenesis protein CcmH/NrfF
MTNLKVEQMNAVAKLPTNLQGAIIELVEEGYSEVEIKKYLSIKFKDAQNFLEEYLAL